MNSSDRIAVQWNTAMKKAVYYVEEETKGLVSERRAWLNEKGVHVQI